MKRILSLLFLAPLLMSAAADTKIVPKKDGGKVIIQSVTAGGVASDVLTIGTTGAKVSAWDSTKRPTQQKFTSGSGTYTSPAGVFYIRVRMVGGGGGGCGVNGGVLTTGTSGTSSLFGSLEAKGGEGASSAGGIPLSGSTTGAGIINFPGSAGGSAQYYYPGTTSASWRMTGGVGGSSMFGGGGRGGMASSNGGAGVANSGGGGGGSSGTSSDGGVGGGGGGGASGIDAVMSPGSYSYTVGSGGPGGDTGGLDGGAGGSGLIVVDEYYN